GPDSRFESIRFDHHGWLVLRSDARDGGAVFVPAFDSRSRGEWLVGVERGGTQTSAGKLRIAGGSDRGRGGGWLCVDLVSVALSADALNQHLHRLSCYRRRLNPRRLIDWLHFREHLVSVDKAFQPRIKGR